jgi:lysophospholipase L1-like esterase
MARFELARRPLSAIGVLAAQVAVAAHRPDIPSCENQDPSGVFGDPGAPGLRIVVLGDSSVTSPGVEPLDASWPRLVAEYLASTYRVDLISVAVGGSKTRDVLANQVGVAAALHPDIAIVSVGGNDALRATPVTRFEQEYDQILSILTRDVPHIIVSGVGDLGSIPRMPMLTRSLARIRGRACDRAVRRAVQRYPGVLKTDTWSPGWDEFNTNPGMVFAADQFHASAYGHRIYAGAIMPAIEEVERRLQAMTGT